MDLTDCKQDKEYFFEEVYFLVEKTMFCVPKHHFEQNSPVFQDMFRLPAGPDTVPDGQTRERPLYLAAIDMDDFRQLLRVLYPRNFNKESLTVAQWTSVLKLSTMWEFQEARTISIDNINNTFVDGVTLLALARDYDVKPWWLRALRLLAEQSALKDEDVERLGAALSMKVALLQGHAAGYRTRDQEINPPTTTEKKAGHGEREGPWEPWEGLKVDDKYTHIDPFINKIFPDVKIHVPSPWGSSPKKKR